MDFAWLDDDSRKAVVVLSEESYTAIESELKELEAKTSLFLDPYGRTRISPGHARFLRELLADSTFRECREVRCLTEMLLTASENERWIVAEGD